MGLELELERLKSVGRYPPVTEPNPSSQGGSGQQQGGSGQQQG